VVVTATSSHLYVPKLRPVSFCTLPAGLKWQWVELPWEGTVRTDLPRSANRYGVIATERPLTGVELDIYDLEPAT
jgi:hypothetical protein